MRKKKKNLKENIINHHNDLWIPSNDLEFEDIKTNSWFDIKYYKSNHTTFENNLKIKGEKIKTKIYCKKIKLDLSTEQKEIINRWLNACSIMYNETIDFIKQNKQEGFNYKKIRTYHLKEKRNEIIEKSKVLIIERNTSIPTHIIDCAIKSACSKFKSAITNYKNGHIKHFRIRKLKHSRPNKVMEIEPCYFNLIKNDKVSLCYKILGDIKYFYNNQEIKLSKINHACNLQYDSKLKEYNLFVPELNYDVSNIKKKEVISIDPGIRTFMSCITENEVIKFGTETNQIIKKELKKIDHIKTIKCKRKIKKKIENRSNKKINHLVNELHWKVIRYLTINYKIILIGNLSTKGIVKNDKSNINKMTKRLSYALSFYRFRQRLEYKSNQENVCLKVIDEAYTSKTCSNCGSYKENLGSSKTYNCNNCNMIIDRDINGSRGIYMVSH